MGRLRDREEQDRREYEAFIEQHPDFAPPALSRDAERQAVGNKEQRTIPLDPQDTQTWDRLTPLFAQARPDEAPKQTDDVNAALYDIGETHRKLLTQRYVERMTLDAIAAEAGITRQAVLKRLAKAEAAFKEVYLG